MEKQNTRRILFCKLAYMQNYDFAVDKDIPLRKGVPVGERINFHDWGNGGYRGYVEVGYKNDKYFRLGIENIDSSAKKTPDIDDVTVVFFAQPDKTKQFVVVGWYEHAMVYREAEIDTEKEYAYYFNTQKENAHLLSENDRKFTVTSAVGGRAGFGRKSIWYAKKPEAQQFVDNVLKYIEAHKA